MQPFTARDGRCGRWVHCPLCGIVLGDDGGSCFPLSRGCGRHGDVPRDWRDDRIAELETMVSKLVAQVEKLTARVQELEEQLGSTA